MKIAVLGSGSIGLYYGAKLAAAGEDVHFLLRSGFDEAGRDGIRVFSPDGDLHLHPVRAHRDPESIGPCDLVLVSLKTTQNDALARLIPPLLGPGTMLLTMQNGLGSDEALAARFGAGRVLGALCFVCLTRRSPAQVDHFGHGTISIGEFDRPPQPRTEKIADAFRRAGIEARVVENLAAERWKKLVWNIPFNGLAVACGGLAATSRPSGVAVDALLAQHLEEVKALMRETIAAAAALGHAIRPDFIDFQVARTEKMGAYQPSTLIDHLAGRELEIDAIWGEPLRRARAAGVPVPHLENLHARLTAISQSGFSPRPSAAKTPPMSSEFTNLPEALEAFGAKTAVILGSGLNSFADALPIEAAIPYDAIPGLPASRVPGHVGAFALARFHGHPLLLARGRVHLYEGWTAREVTAGVRLLHRLGVTRLLLTNAAGTLNPAFPPGQWMMLADHLNLTGTTPLLGGANFIDLTAAYDARLREAFRLAAAEAGVPLHEGVYASLLGPQYETPAEVRMLRALGADAVGMSTVLETIQARALGLEVAAFSCLTNWAAGLSGQALSHAEVTDTGRRAAGALIQILDRSLPRLL